jgi:hypothetical protein
MMKWFFRIVMLAILVAIGIWGWGILFPNAERAIRARLAEVAQAASFSAKESPAAQAMNSQRLTTFCTDDIEIVVELPGAGRHQVSGHDELFAGAMGARTLVAGLNVEFKDVTVTVAPDKQSAIAILTGKGNVPGEKDLLVQEMKFKLKKVGRGWYIQRIETVKSLSDGNSNIQHPTSREASSSKFQTRQVSRSLSELRFGVCSFSGCWMLNVGCSLA